MSSLLQEIKKTEFNLMINRLYIREQYILFNHAITQPKTLLGCVIGSFTAGVIIAHYGSLVELFILSFKLHNTYKNLQLVMPYFVV